MRDILCALACALSFGAAAHDVSPLPPAVEREFPRLQPLGHARATHWMVPVYDATLWTEGAHQPGTTPYALDLRYSMALAGSDITSRSVQEMRGLGYADETQLARWSRAMDRIFPDVRAGDRLVGVAVPGREARFYDAGRLLGTVEDAEFVPAFFGIWLDARTSQPAMRRQLLKQPAR